MISLLHDLEEDHDPALPYISGSDLDGASWDQDDILECGRAMGMVPVT